MGQDQPRVTSWTSCKGPEHQMLHAKTQGHRPLEKNIFEGFLPYMGMSAILVMCDCNHMNKITFIPPIKVPYQISLQSAQ